MPHPSPTPRPSPPPARRAAAAHDAARLSPQQRAVAELVAAGHTNAEIAEALGISTFTARNHVGRVLEKLNVPRRAGVGACLARQGRRPPAPARRRARAAR